MDELVLIVDDNEKNVKLVRDLLRFADFRTLEAFTAGAGVSMAAEHLPHVILMDLQLPGIDGHAALSLLRADCSTWHIPVVALTAFAMAQDRDRALAAGFDGYLEKPIDVRRFPEQVRSYCRPVER